MTLREAAQQALKAMEKNTKHLPLHFDNYFEAMYALRAALAEDALERMSEDERRLGIQMQPMQEPVAWRWGYRSVTTGEMDWRGYVEIPSHPSLRSPEIIMEPLYTAQRKENNDA